jgi:2-(1,2-epoxy-1,2-dihydrophenyl)acetyl-CoA isomerase
MGDTTVRYEMAEGIATITLNRPERLNALSYALKDALLAACATAGADPAVRAVVLTGAGRAFCAGGDMQDLLVHAFEQEPELREQQAVRGFNAMVRALRHLEKPVVAAVNGPAVGGGCCLAVAADVRLASPQATFGMVFTKIGLAGADMGATFLLPRLVGMGHASELLLTGATIDAARAERIGLVNRVVEAAALAAEARALAAQLAAGPPLALAATKRAINRSLGCDIDTHLDYEAYVQSKCMGTADFQEGVRAFLERRTPRFIGR